tara:strand:+ start:506 stop:847 length:342 start_codon:yes stop_codon:yes gene_type:complete
METKHQTLIVAALEKVQSCETILEKISSSCCMPIRSKKMQDTFKGLENLGNQLKEATEESMSNSIVEIEQCGSQIGKLYVSCCTEKREPLYQQLLKELNEVHNNVHRVKGTAH